MSLHHSLYLNNYAALMALVKTSNLSAEVITNLTNQISEIRGIDTNFSSSDDLANGSQPDEYISGLVALKVVFYCLYILIFFVGIAGNLLVCYVVMRNKSMQTVTNLFITNLAMSDILLCVFAVPFTPLYLLTFKTWVFGQAFCHLVPYAQGVSVYISAFTLMSIAIDRFFVIIYPFKPRMEIKICYIIIGCIWMAAMLLTLPYGLFVDVIEDPQNPHQIFCDEVWPYEESRRAFGFSTSVLQFVIPFIIISFCYIKVCAKLRDRARAKPGAKSVKKEELERERTRRTNRMLISMVVIFGVSWLPLNIHNLVMDFYIPASHWRYSRAFFLMAHAAAMSSTCYNPFLYAWLNENFRKEFKTVLPCFESATITATPSQRRGFNSTAGGGKPERTNAMDCNGHDTAQDCLLPAAPRDDSFRQHIRTRRVGSEQSEPLEMIPLEQVGGKKDRQKRGASARAAQDALQSQHFNQQTQEEIVIEEEINLEDDDCAPPPPATTTTGGVDNLEDDNNQLRDGIQLEIITKQVKGDRV